MSKTVEDLIIAVEDANRQLRLLAAAMENLEGMDVEVAKISARLALRAAFRTELAARDAGEDPARLQAALHELEPIPPRVVSRG